LTGTEADLASWPVFFIVYWFVLLYQNYLTFRECCKIPLPPILSIHKL